MNAIEWYFAYLQNTDKLSAVGKIVKYVQENSVRTILSLGAGPGVLEYMLCLMLGEGIKVVATDYDSFFVEKEASYSLQWFLIRLTSIMIV